MTHTNKHDYMTLTPVPRLIGELALPTICSMLVTGLYNTADTFFVSRISREATAAVGIVFSLMAMIQALGFFCGHGSGNYLSRALGAGDTKSAHKMAATGFCAAVILGVLLCITGEVCLIPLSYLLGAVPSIISETQEYMRIILLGAPFMMASIVLNNQLRFQGSAIYSMAGLVSGAVVNIALDPFMMFTCGMGVAGAALATITGQTISLIILFVGSRRGENIRIDARNVALNKHYIKEIINGGSPSLFRQGLGAVGIIVLNKTAGMLGGDSAIAGMSVTNRTTMLMMAALIGFGQGFQPVCAYNYGAGLHKRVIEAFWFCVRWGTVFCTSVAIPMFILAPYMIRLFRTEDLVVSVGVSSLRFQMVSFPLGAYITMSNMMLQSIGMGARASVLASARQGTALIPFVLILSFIFGIKGVEASQMAADCAAFLLSIALTRKVIRRP